MPDEGGIRERGGPGAGAAEPRPGFHEKDKVENYLHAQVCNGAMSMADAQNIIATDWLSVYNQMPK